MTATAISTTARALLDAAQQKFASAEARTEAGGQGWWPPPGNHECLITDISVEDAETELQGGMKIPCARIQFHYQLTPTGKVSAGLPPDEPGEWRGDSFSIYSDSDFAKLPDNWQKAVGISMERMKGHFKTLLRLSDAELSVSPAALIDAGKQKIASSTGAICVVQCQERVQKKNIAPGATPKVYRSEYLYELVSG